MTILQNSFNAENLINGLLDFDLIKNDISVQLQIFEDLLQPEYCYIETFKEEQINNIIKLCDISEPSFVKKYFEHFLKGLGLPESKKFVSHLSDEQVQNLFYFINKNEHIKSLFDNSFISSLKSQKIISIKTYYEITGEFPLDYPFKNTYTFLNDFVFLKSDIRLLLKKNQSHSFFNSKNLLSGLIDFSLIKNSIDVQQIILNDLIKPDNLYIEDLTDPEISQLINFIKLSDDFIVRSYFFSIFFSKELPDFKKFTSSLNLSDFKLLIEHIENSTQLRSLFEDSYFNSLKQKSTISVHEYMKITGLMPFNYKFKKTYLFLKNPVFEKATQSLYSNDS